MSSEKKIGPIKIKYGSDNTLKNKHKFIVIITGLSSYLIIGSIFSILNKIDLITVIFSGVFSLLIAIYVSAYYRYLYAKKNREDLEDDVVYY